jgi:hypothetical protein
MQLLLLLLACVCARIASRRRHPPGRQPASPPPRIDGAWHRAIHRHFFSATSALFDAARR